MPRYRLFRPVAPLLLLAAMLTLFSANGRAEEAPKDSISLAAKHDANKAALMSAIVPGLGQIHNRKYWKVPVIYGGGLTLAYFIQQNNQYYQKYKSAYINRLKGVTANDPYPSLSSQDLQVRKDYYRRNRDLSYILSGVLYVMNIIDAYVDAHLRTFDVSDNLSLQSGPGLELIPGSAPAPGLRFVLTFP